MSLQIRTCKISRVETAQTSWARAAIPCCQSNVFNRLNNPRSLCLSSEISAPALDHHTDLLLDLIQKQILKLVYMQNTTASILYNLAKGSLDTLCCVIRFETRNVKCKYLCEHFLLHSLS